MLLLAAACGSTPLYGPPEPAQPAHRSASANLQQFRRAETGPLARAFQADAATFNQASHNRQIAPSVLGEDAYRVSSDIQAWLLAMKQAPVPADYRQAKAQLLHGLKLLQRGYRHIGDGLLYNDAAQLSQGRADVRSGSAILGAAAADVSL